MKYVLVILYVSLTPGPPSEWENHRRFVEVPTLFDCLRLRDQKNVTEFSTKNYRYVGSYCEAVE